MSTVGESQDPPWKDVLYTKGLSAAATILEEYGLSCESDMSLVDEDDLVVLCSKLKPFQSKLLRKWVQGLGAEQRAAAFMKDASAAKNHSTSPPLEDKGAEDEDEEENGDEDADADEDEDLDEEDKEVHGGAAGEQGAGDGKSDEDVRIICQQSAQHHKEDGKRAKECVCENDAAAAKKAKTSTLSTEQQSFVSKFNPAPAKIDKERKISTRHVKGRLNSLKKQGARLNDVKGATIAKRLQEFSGNFLSLVSGQLWCAACSSNVGSAKSAVEQHCKGQEHLRKVQRKIDGSDRGTKIIESIQAYKDIVKDSTGGQEAVGFERVALNVQVHQQLYNINYLLPNYSV